MDLYKLSERLIAEVEAEQDKYEVHVAGMVDGIKALTNAIVEEIRKETEEMKRAQEAAQANNAVPGTEETTGSPAGAVEASDGAVPTTP